MLIVVTPATSHRLTTPSAVRERLEVGEAISDVQVEEWVDAASLSIADFCERRFGRERLRQIIRAPGYLGGDPQLARLPATIVSLTVDGRALPQDQYYLDAESGCITRLRGGLPESWWWGGTVVAEYWAGWVLPEESGRTLPQNVEEACLMLISAQRHAQIRDPQLRSRSTEGVGMESYTDYRSGAGGMPQHIAERLTRYIRYSVA
ncbi:hypothetical protein [Teichococcus aestuarii]|uniref:hypothetical protein n=2 Tax=Teichococcus aestuarii TaxID=568898 RepID=UPI00362454FF